MRKFLAVTATVAASALALTACGSNTPGTGASSAAPSGSKSASTAAAAGAITMWVDSNREPALKTVAEQFKKDTGVTVNLVIKENSKIVDDFITQAPSGQGPDAIISAHDNVGKMVQNGVIAPVELGNTKASYQEVAVKGFTYGGKTYGVPYATENLALIRNTKLAAAAPKTWDEAVAAGKASKAQFPILVGGDDATKASAYNLYPLQMSFNAPVFGTDVNGSYDPSKLTMGGTNGANFAKWLSAQAKAGIFKLSITNDVAISEFAAGKSPYIVTGPWNVQKIKDAKIAYSIEAIPSAGGQVAAPFVGVQGFVMSAYSKNTVATQKFLVEYLGTEKVQTELFKIGNRAPANKAAFEAAKSDKDVAAFGAVAAAGVPMPNVPAMNGVWADWGNALTQIVDQKAADPAATWQTMVTTLETKLK